MGRHCQLDQPGTFSCPDAEVSVPVQQTQVTASHSANARVRRRGIVRLTLARHNAEMDTRRGAVNLSKENAFLPDRA